MSGEVTVKVSGLKELQDALEHMAKNDVKTALKEGLSSGATVMLATLQQEAPKDTGFLAKHFNVKYSIKGSEVQGSAFVGPQGHMDYPLAGGTYAQKINKRGRKYKSGRIPVVTVARFLEFGTGRMTANPFITRAFESAKSLVSFRIIDSLRKTLRL